MSSKDNKKQNLLGAPLTPRKTKSRSSLRSVGSRGSLDSIGMAPNARPPPESRASPLSTSLEYRLRFRLLPEGTGDNDFNVFERNIYDCMVFVIYCENHSKVALTSINDKNRKYSWFPFVLIHESFTYLKTIDDGVAIILGKTDAEMDQTMAISLPKYDHQYIGMQNTQCPKTRKYHQRVAVLIKIKEGNESRNPNDFQCCVDTSKIRWLPYEDLIGRKVANEFAWGDEVIHLARQLRAEERLFLTELIVDRVLLNSNADEAALLEAAKFNSTKITDLYTEYLHHLYPASMMTIHSFRCFLLKYPMLPQEDIRNDRIFFACVCEGKRFCHFRQLLLAIAAMEPGVPTKKQRIRIQCLFRFYDNSTKGVIAPEVCAQLLADIHRAANSSGKPPNPAQVFGNQPVTLEVFEAAVNANKLPNIDLMLRSKRSYFDVKKLSSSTDYGLSDWVKWVGGSSSQQQPHTSSSGKKAGGNSTPSKGRGSASSPRVDPRACAKHSVKKYDYAVHTVSIDNSSRCVDPRIITDNWINNWGPNELTMTRFSVEHLFRINAVHNIFLDLVRDFNRKGSAKVSSQVSNSQENDTRGILCAKDDWATLFHYFELLCKQLLNILRAEPKLLRLSSPTCVAGDLLGSLPDLMAIEKTLYPAVPVVPPALVFLGNYIGPGPSVELLIYIFSLKVQNPNKVYLLRGRNEICFNNRMIKKLHRELKEKYGDHFGKNMWSLINKVFDTLPVAAYIDDAILACHSGIPNLPKNETLVGYFNKNYSGPGFDYVNQIEKQMPIAHQLIANVPEQYAPPQFRNAFKGSKTAVFQSSKSKSKYLYFNGAAFIDFLAKNRLEYLIRSHNPSNEGFVHCYSCRCLTIFSNSHISATSRSKFFTVALVNDRKLRVVRFKSEDVDRQGSGVDVDGGRHGSKIRTIETRISTVDSKASGH